MLLPALHAYTETPDWTNYFLEQTQRQYYCRPSFEVFIQQREEGYIIYFIMYINLLSGKTDNFFFSPTKTNIGTIKYLKIYVYISRWNEGWG